MNTCIFPVNNNSGDIVIKLKKNAVFFTIGSIGYGIIELLWRGRTHWTMLLAGGVCFSFFSFAAEKFKKYSIFMRTIICAFAITIIEFVFGFVLGFLFFIFILLIRNKLYDIILNNYC